MYNGLEKIPFLYPMHYLLFSLEMNKCMSCSLELPLNFSFSGWKISICSFFQQDQLWLHTTYQNTISKDSGLFTALSFPLVMPPPHITLKKRRIMTSSNLVSLKVAYHILHLSKLLRWIKTVEQLSPLQTEGWPSGFWRHLGTNQSLWVIIILQPALEKVVWEGGHRSRLAHKRLSNQPVSYLACTLHAWLIDLRTLPCESRLHPWKSLKPSFQAIGHSNRSVHLWLITAVRLG